MRCQWAALATQAAAQAGRTLARAARVRTNPHISYTCKHLQLTPAIYRNGQLQQIHIYVQ